MNTGFALLRWGMSVQQVRGLYPRATTTPAYEGRNPRTGEKVVVGGDTLVPEIQEVVPGLMVNATLAFDPSDRLVSISLWPDLEPALPGPRNIDAQLVLRGAQELARVVGIGSLSEVPENRDWVIDETKIELTNDDGFRFELSRPVT
jgi:hypothetical protein